MDASTKFGSLVRPALRAWLVLAAGLALPALVMAASLKKNPTSKFYVADVDGDAQIDTGDRVDDLNKKSVYNAEGTVIETKPKAANAMVFSNGTGIFFDEDTRVEVRRFEQEPFVPNRTDMDTEPSISQTQAYLPRGTVGLCTSKLVAGSKMTYRTPLGSVNIRSGKVVIQSENGVTKISLLQGESTVSAGGLNMGGHPLQDGQQAVITSNPNGGAPTIKVQPIPQNERSALEGKITMACTAKKTVYFQTVTGRAANNSGNSAVAVDFSIAAASAGSSSASPSSSSESTSISSTGGSSPITAFDGDSANATITTTVTSSSGAGTAQAIVAVPVVPTNLPVQFTVSPANLSTSSTANP